MGTDALEADRDLGVHDGVDDEFVPTGHLGEHGAGRQRWVSAMI